MGWNLRCWTGPESWWALPHQAHPSPCQRLRIRGAAAAAGAPEADPGFTARVTTRMMLCWLDTDSVYASPRTGAPPPPGCRRAALHHASPVSSGTIRLLRLHD